MPRAERTAAVVLAAGRGQRLGGVNKALLTVSGTPFLNLIVASLSERNVDPIIVVTGGPHHLATEAVAKILGVTAVYNDRACEGMATSIARGFAELADRGALWSWLWPVDTPRVRGTTLDDLWSARHQGAIVSPLWKGRGGHPILVRQDVFGEFARCVGLPEGARSVVRRDEARRCRVEVDDELTIADIDQPSDLEGIPR